MYMLQVHNYFADQTKTLEQLVWTAISFLNRVEISVASTIHGRKQLQVKNIPRVLSSEAKVSPDQMS